MDRNEYNEVVGNRKRRKSKANRNSSSSNSRTRHDTDDKPHHMSPCKRFEKLDDVIGRGTFKTVLLGYDHLSKVKIAWCVLNLNPMNDNERVRSKKEILILKSLKNDNIIRYVDYWETTNNTHREGVLITELMTNGSLRTFLGNMKDKPEPTRIYGWCINILNGLHYLHTRSPPIIHKDLTCSNIFVCAVRNILKIGDFGLATLKRSLTWTTNVAGTPGYMAPEIYDGKCGKESDVFAFGMCVIEMATKEKPFYECEKLPAIMKKIIQGCKPMSFMKVEDPKLQKCIEGCISVNKDQRFTIPVILEFFQPKSPSFKEPTSRLTSHRQQQPDDGPPQQDPPQNTNQRQKPSPMLLNSLKRFYAGGKSASICNVPKLVQIQQMQQEEEDKKQEVEELLRSLELAQEQKKKGHPWKKNTINTSECSFTPDLQTIQNEEMRKLRWQSHKDTTIVNKMNLAEAAVWGTDKNNDNHSRCRTYESKPAWEDSDSCESPTSSESSSSSFRFWDDAADIAAHRLENGSLRQGRKRHNEVSMGTSPQNREMESEFVLFQAKPLTGDFTEWCEGALRDLKNPFNVDVSTFADLLRAVDSPKEMSDYVTTHFGIGRGMVDFLRKCFEKRGWHSKKQEKHETWSNANRLYAE